MAEILLVISAICFIAAFGIHMFAKNGMDWCGYMEVPWMSAIPWICGFILAVIPETVLFDVFWLWMFLINAIVVWALGPLVTRMFLRRLASGKGAGIDIITAIVIGILSLIVGIILK